MQIVELAQRVALTTTASRFHEQARLLPRPARTPSGSRNSDDTAPARLRFVRAAQGAGLPCGDPTVIKVREDEGPPCKHVTTCSTGMQLRSTCASPSCRRPARTPARRWCHHLALRRLPKGRCVPRDTDRLTASAARRPPPRPERARPADEDPWCRPELSQPAPLTSTTTAGRGRSRSVPSKGYAHDTSKFRQPRTGGRNPDWHSPARSAWWGRGAPLD